MGGIKHPLTTGDIAAYFKMSVEGAHKWLKEGKLKAFRTPGGQFRVEREDFLEFLRDNNMPIDLKFFGLSKKRVLVVDDDTDVVKTLSRAIETVGDYDISTANNGLQAGFVLGQEKPDLLVVDIEMPGMDGLSLCRIAKENEETQHATILIVSAFIDDSVREQAGQLGVVRCLTKPVDILDFCSAVKECLEPARKRRKRTTGLEASTSSE